MPPFKSLIGLKMRKKIYFSFISGTLLCLLLYPAEVKQDIPVETKRLKAHVQELTSISPPRNCHNVQSLDHAAAYINKEFNKWNNRVVIQVYKAGEKEYKNIIASFGPEKGKRIIVGAHYDVCGEQPGADDNGSGVASLLELVRLLSILKPKLKQRIDLAAYTLEEPPYFRSRHMGSAVHAGSLKKAGVNVKAMISVDMIGYFSEKAKPLRFVAPFIKPGTVLPGRTTVLVNKKGAEKLTGLIRKYMEEKSGGIKVAALNLPINTPGVDFSDHLNFWNNGYPGVVVTNFFVSPNPHYHRPADRIHLLDFGKIAGVTRGLYWALINL